MTSSVHHKLEAELHLPAKIRLPEHSEGLPENYLCGWLPIPPGLHTPAALAPRKWFSGKLP
jgi:hypothetical protein